MNTWDDSDSAISSNELSICSSAFTATGSCLVVLDSYGQFYVYRMSPISDPGKYK